MNINANIVDQQLRGLIDKFGLHLNAGDADKTLSNAFAVYCIKTRLLNGFYDAFPLYSNVNTNNVIDGIYIGDATDGKFSATIFQCRYNKELDGSVLYPESDVKSLVEVVESVLSPAHSMGGRRDHPRLAEIRSLMQDGYSPDIRVVMCNNGQRWNDASQAMIDNLESKSSGKVKFEHFNHDSIVSMLQPGKRIDTRVQLCGKIIVEDMNYVRSLVGRIPVSVFYELLDRHGYRLFQNNIRNSYVRDNSVNTAMQDLLCSSRAGNFSLYNGGITVICDKFDYNASQSHDVHIQLYNMQVIDGEDVCKAIYTYGNTSNAFADTASVMVRICQLPENNHDFVKDIINSKKHIDFRDDNLQKRLAQEMEMLGFSYKQQGGREINGLSSGQVAESTLAIWREKPHQARYMKGQHFGELYHEIFDDLNAAQAVFAVLIQRAVELELSHPEIANSEAFLPYASHHISMLTARHFLQSQSINVQDISNANFADLCKGIADTSIKHINRSICDIKQALCSLYGSMRDISMEQISAAFRNGELDRVLCSDNYQYDRCAHTREIDDAFEDIDMHEDNDMECCLHDAEPRFSERR